MRRAFESKTVIDRPAAEVWRELTDWERAPRWMPGIDAMSCDAGTAPGSTVTFRTRGRARTSTITEVEPGRALTLVSVQGGVTARYTYRLLPSDDRTRVRLTADVATAGPWVVLGPVVRAAIRRADAHQLTALREVVQGGRV
ncbi:SRPBCC family protein [Pseudonocardia lacus]|uniref:SRPBCC family protein n=1 Tax=Pseudonocardia lacus TaxID=2835865 RepID=UPI001BDBF8C4|nr:SRPBCC family protein [Pseudonocardia lacus]